MSLRKYGLSPKAVVEERDLKRLVVPTFLHIDLDHALNNASSLLQTGTERERRVGTERFILDVAVLIVLSNG
ncbi:hypothetical protein WJX81_003807 [Elliptochloris bilobata]|uniref:Peptidase S54 rhomboid domain-containing protein n=1 Tax=Elliptochloris bilobata TaxID=381761 RepID=A0AAW1SG97_9CHLO